MMRNAARRAVAARWRVFVCLGIGMLASASAWSADEYRPPVSILYELIRVAIQADASSVTEYTREIRVEREDAVSSEGEDRFTYSSSLESVEVLEAYVIEPDGRRIDVHDDSIRITDANSAENAPQFSDYKSLVIIYPKVRVGSRIGYRVRMVEREPAFPGYYSFANVFSPHIPVERFDIEFRYPESFRLDFENRGLTELPATREQGLLVRRFNYVQRLVVPPEPSEASWSDFAPRLLASNFVAWKNMALAYRSRAQSKAEVTPEVRQLAAEIVGDVSDPREKLRKLYNWVSREIRYVSIALGSDSVVPHDANWILQRRFGDCKDHATLLEALLAAQGIESHPVLIGTAPNYDVPSIPILEYFNHVITYIPAFDLFVDSTAEYLPMGQLITPLSGKTALETGTGEMRQLPFLSARTNGVVTSIDFEILPDGRVAGHTRERYAGHLEFSERSKMAGYAGRTQDQLMRTWLSGSAESGTGSITSSDPRNLDERYVLESTFLLDEMVNVPGPGAFAVPMGVSFGGIRLAATARRPLERRLPFLCDSFRFDEEISVKMPELMLVTRIPDDAQFSGSRFRYQSSYRLANNVVRIKRVLEVDGASRICQPVDEEERSMLLRMLRRDLRQQIYYQ